LLCCALVLIYSGCYQDVISPGSDPNGPPAFVSFSGDLYGYEPEANKAEGVLELNLDEVVSDLVYPVAVPVDGLIQDTGISITAHSVIVAQAPGQWAFTMIDW